MADNQDKKNKARPAVKVPIKVSASRTVDAEQESSDRKSLGDVRKTFALLGMLAIAYVVYLVVTGQVDEFVSSLAGVDMGWIVAGVICYLFYYVFGVMAYVLSVVADPNCPVGFRDLMSVEASGVFFMRMTPSGAGAPPAQIFRLTRAGMSVGAAGALQFTRFVIYEAGEGIFSGIMLLLFRDYFFSAFGNFATIGVALFGFKVVQVAGILALCLLPRPVMAISNWGLNLARRHNWIKEEKYRELSTFVNTQMTEFSNAFKMACRNVGELVATLVVTLLQLGCMYALPYFVLRSFGSEADFFICVALGSMIELVVNATPLPGGAGGAEVGFSYLFAGLYGEHITAGFVIWRAIEYLLPVLIAAPCMGMRSNSNLSINLRLKRFRQSATRLGVDVGLLDGKRGAKTRKVASGEIRVPMGKKKITSKKAAGERKK